MFITKIELTGKNKYKVFLEGKLAFALYRGELAHYDMEEGKDLSEENYRDILSNILVKRARLRCLNLLKRSDQTEWQLRTKLKQGNYPDEIIENAIAYVKSFGYVDDFSYASRYIDFKQNVKSRQSILQELMQNGISKEIISEVFSTKEMADETELIRKWMEKKHFIAEHASLEEKRKFYQFLFRKGFSSSDIKKAIHETEW